MSSLLTWLACFAPIAVLFAGIAFAHAKVPVAAGAGLAVALLSGIAVGSLGSGELLEGASSGIRTALSILYAVWPAMFLYDILRESGAFATIRRFAQSATHDALALVLMFSWAFSSFLQSITGFGVPVAVCAPFLVALGIRPVPAVVMTLIGHSWGNTFGTLGMAWDALALMGPVDDEVSTAMLSGALLWMVNLSGGAIVAFIYGRGRALAHGLPLIALLSAAMGGGQMALAEIDAAIACFIPSTASLILFAFIIKLGFYKKSWNCPSRVTSAEGVALPCIKESPSTRDALLCASPFIFLAVVSVAIFTIPGAKEAASVIQLGGIPLFAHAGFALLASCVFSFAVMTKAGRLSPQGRIDAAKGALLRLRGASAGIILLVVMAQIMQSTGQMQILAEGAAWLVGSMYVPFSPAIGTFGAFVTSSNMSSNILLAGFQHAMANSLGIDPSLLLAAQTAGGAAGAAIGPSTILLGATTVGAVGKEGAMLKPLLAISFAQTAFLGLIVFTISVI